MSSHLRISPLSPYAQPPSKKAQKPLVQQCSDTLENVLDGSEGNYTSPSQNAVENEIYNETIKQNTKNVNAVKKKTKGEKLTPEEIASRLALTDYIQSIYPPDVPNWPLFAQQIKKYCAEYDLTFDDLHDIIKYAMEFEHHELRPDYTLNQFIPKYIEPERKFIKTIQRNRRLAKTMCLENGNKIVIVKPHEQQRANYNVKFEAFDDE